MSHFANDRPELVALLEALCSNRITAAQAARLEEMLRSSPGAREMYVDYMVLHAGIAWRLRGTEHRVAGMPAASNGAGDPSAKSRIAAIRGGRAAFRLNSFALIASLAGLFLLLSLAAIVPAYLSLRQAQWENAQRELQDEQERQLAASKAQDEKIAESKAKQASRALFGVYAKLLSERNPLPAARAVGDSVAWVYAHGLAQARLTFGVDCRWGGAAPDVGEALTRGRRLELKAGLAEIVFQNGARTILQGPATLQILSGSGACLTLGRYTVNVEDARAKGFEVDAPGMKYTDLGTEFGVMVDADGEQEMHVFRGTVEAQQTVSTSNTTLPSPSGRGAGGEGNNLPSPSERGTEGEGGSSAARPLLLTAHEAIRVAAPAEPGKPAAPIESIAADEKQFVRSQQLSEMLGERSPEFQRWKEYSDALRKRPDLVAYYDFQPDEADRGILRNRAATGTKLDGRIERATWVEGHLPGKKALRFAGRGDRVRVNIPGSYPILTAAAWLNVANLANAGNNSILMSDRWFLHVGQCHWQITGDGRIEIGPCWSTTRRAALPAEVSVQGPACVLRQDEMNSWIHCTVVYNAGAQTVTYYKDGHSCGTQKFGHRLPLVFGPSQIANWEPDARNDDPVRNLYGRIDELLLLARALSAQEVEQLYKSSK